MLMAVKTKRPLTKAARRRMMKRIRKQQRTWRKDHANPTAEKSILSRKVIERIDGIVRNMRSSGEIDIDVLDYRFWECIRCRFNPRRVIGMRNGLPYRIYDWWRELHPQDRMDVVELSRKCERPTPRFNQHRIQLWSKNRA